MTSTGNDSRTLEAGPAGAAGAPVGPTADSAQAGSTGAVGDHAEPTAASAPFNREISPPLDLGLPYWFHLFFPDRSLSTDLNILVAGCGDDLAARLARANPRARITAVDDRDEALESAASHKQQQKLDNLELAAAWPPEPGWVESFDLIYHNGESWPLGEPQALLTRLGRLLRRDGSLHLTLRARQAWTGVRMLRELLERLGIEADSEGYPKARQVVAALPSDHPSKRLAPDSLTRPDDLLADWLRPEQPCFGVPEIYDLLARCGLKLQRFTYPPYYLPQCSPVASTPLLAEIRLLPIERQQALMELHWPAIRYHLLLACRADRPASSFRIDFDSPQWVHYAPLLPAHLPLEEEASSIGAKARLRWRAPGMPEVGISLGGFQYRLLQALDRAEDLGDVVGLAGLSGDPQLRDEWAREFFRTMWEYDFLHFRTCRPAAQLPPAPRDPWDAAARAPGVEPLKADAEAQPVQPVADAPDLLADDLERLTANLDRLVEDEEPLFDSEEMLADAEDRLGAAWPQEPARQPSAGIDSEQEDASAYSQPSDEQTTSRSGDASASVDAEARWQPERIPYQTCPLCDDPGYEAFREAEAELLSTSRVLKVKVPWMRCARCGHVFTEGYFAGQTWQLVQQQTLAWRATLRRAAARRTQASRIVSTITTLRERAAGRWLDVNCSHTGLVTVADEFGYESVGVDSSPQAAERFRKLGYTVRCGSLFDCQDGPFNVISLSGILDQMPFPAEALRHAHRLLGPNGLLFVSAPTMDSLTWRNLDLENTNPYWSRLERYHNFRRKSLFSLLQNTRFEPCGYSAAENDRFGMEVVGCKV